MDITFFLRFLTLVDNDNVDNNDNSSIDNSEDDCNNFLSMSSGNFQKCVKKRLLGAFCSRAWEPDFLT